MECQNVIRGTTQLPTHGFGQTSVEGMKGRVATGNGIRYPTSKAQWIYGGGGPGGYLTILTMAATCGIEDIIQIQVSNGAYMWETDTSKIDR